MERTRKKLLVVADLGGSPPDLRTLAELADVYVYVPRPSAVTARYMEDVGRYAHGVLKEPTACPPGGYEHPASVTFTGARPYTLTEEQLADRIAEAAAGFGADGILFGGAENIVLSVAKAAEQLGLRSAGVQGAVKARGKLEMRQAFRAGGAPGPDFRPIYGADDLAAAARELGYPLVLKPTYLACSIGVTLLDGSRDPAEVFREVQASLGSSEEDRLLYGGECLFLAESYMAGCAEDWYGELAPLYGDYVSVEGMMVDGVYHPAAITDKAPQHGEFTETAHLVPSALDAEAQRVIVEACRVANEALGLRTCPTHTEVKLLKGRRVGIIETAARFGGWNIVPQLRDVYGIDMTRAWALAVLYGSAEGLPSTALREADAARCNMRLYLEDDARTQVGGAYVYAGYEREGLLPDGVRLAAEQELPVGSVVRRIPGQNAMSFVSTLQLEADRPQELAAAVRRIRSAVRLRLAAVDEAAGLAAPEEPADARPGMAEAEAAGPERDGQPLQESFSF
ncbi:ATP-grasp domain-containing protein [Paenibacillus pasadenensis]|uniref:Diguanylate cyclase/phosphodiesterase (GGDEF & EAL domains) with PAS/PAC sensor(S) n=1 Tax=Paenibacillus pasadenensis TaxID=217090 RepID=A0A2N5N2Z4_9BACL|nr:ATP-grasp domain-containing protein [Paenibacillus pasadenensis]PLT44696.1 diguanylate cyclase/phosphodiesterase (GGDEF & EAL domains) with PAS/PAC sensor(s) [Paenibacillus pasadenensis]